MKMQLGFRCAVHVAPQGIATCKVRWRSGRARFSHSSVTSCAHAQWTSYMWPAHAQNHVDAYMYLHMSSSTIVDKTMPSNDLHLKFQFSSKCCYKSRFFKGSQSLLEGRIGLGHLPLSLHSCQSIRVGHTTAYHHVSYDCSWWARPTLQGRDRKPYPQKAIISILVLSLDIQSYSFTCAQCTSTEAPLFLAWWMKWQQADRLSSLIQNDVVSIQSSFRNVTPNSLSAFSTAVW